MAVARDRFGVGLPCESGEAVCTDVELEALEERLARECEDLERQLHDNRLAFENASLEVQLVQMQDDYAALQEDSESFRKYSTERIDDLSRQLEEQAQAACDSEGRADCLRDRLGYHVDQGQLEGKYWRTQCEKRNDSICFLTLKLQEYTVPSHEYSRSREVKFFQKDTDYDEVGAGNCASGADPQRQSPQMAGSPRLPPSPFRAWRTPRSPKGVVAPSRDVRELLESEHQALCREVARQEEGELQGAQELQHCELSSAVLQAKRAFWEGAAAGVSPATRPAADASVVPENGVARALDGMGEHSSSQRPQSDTPGAPITSSGAPATVPLRDRVAFLRQALAVSLDDAGLPSWTQQCTWKEELDVRAGQLERVSLQLDAMKRALDAANEELHWQAKCADDLRMGAAEIWRTSKVAGLKAADTHAECMQSELAISELMERLQKQT